jgi:hypothetical protein
LSHALKSIATKLSYEDVHLTATHIIECAANVFNICVSFLHHLMKDIPVFHRSRPYLGRAGCQIRSSHPCFQISTIFGRKSAETGAGSMGLSRLKGRSSREVKVLVNREAARSKGLEAKVTVGVKELRDKATEREQEFRGQMGLEDKMVGGGSVEKLKTRIESTSFEVSVLNNPPRLIQSQIAPICERNASQVPYYVP